jgi:hypothetical protein
VTSRFFGGKSVCFFYNQKAVSTFVFADLDLDPGKNLSKDPYADPGLDLDL